MLVVKIQHLTPNVTKGSLTGNTSYMEADIGASPTAAARSAYVKAVDQCLSFGYASALSFKDGDNPAITKYKPWKNQLKVEITKVTAIAPDVEMTKDPLKGVLLEMKSGVLFGADTHEQLRNPEIKVDEYFTLHTASSLTQIEQKPSGVQSLTAANVLSQIAAARGSAYDELLDYLGRASLPGRIAGFSGMRFEWKNDSFAVRSESKMKDTSSAAKSIKGERDNGQGGKVEIKWMFTNWNKRQLSNRETVSFRRGCSQSSRRMQIAHRICLSNPPL